MKELDKRGGKLDLGEKLDIGPIGKVPQREECPICMRVLPVHSMLQTYSECCGKTVCGGCERQHQMKNNGQALPHMCAFCRTVAPRSDEEDLAQLRKRVELKDPDALLNMAMDYGDGGFGLPVDHAKCIELLREAADLGHPPAQCQLGNFYRNGGMGLEQNKKEAQKNYEQAAEGGDLDARHNLACAEKEAGNEVAAMRHCRLAASGGYRDAMDGLVSAFENGLLRHGDLAETLQAFYRSRDEMKSEGRDQYITYLKMKGEYKEEYEC